MPFKLLVASHNADKLREIRDILRDISIEVLSMNDFPGIAPVVEDCDTLPGNAMKKALEVAKLTGMLTMADDTGIFIDALCGEPGVYSARYAGENCTYADNQNKVLAMMQGIGARDAFFKTVIAIASPSGILALHEGCVHGRITHEKRGSKGFGYDPVFEVVGTGKTYSEMDDSQKNSLSHRALAIKSMLPILKELAETYSS
jgi:XTP/dITP diphosphohydrolase